MNLPKFITESGIEVMEYQPIDKSVGILNSWLNYSYNDYEYIVYDVECMHTLKQLLRNSLRFSCCGDEISLDCQLCPSCLEHI